MISLPWGKTIIALGIMIFGFAVIILLARQFVLKYITRLPGIGYALSVDDPSGNA
jgi:hypothetical protein